MYKMSQNLQKLAFCNEHVLMQFVSIIVIFSCKSSSFLQNKYPSSTMLNKFFGDSQPPQKFLPQKLR